LLNNIKAENTKAVGGAGTPDRAVRAVLRHRDCRASGHTVQGPHWCPGRFPGSSGRPAPSFARRRHLQSPKRRQLLQWKRKKSKNERWKRT